MYSLTVRDHIMIAHSFTGEVFGPAQNMHGATFVVEVELRRPSLNADGIIIDIGLGLTLLAEVLKPLNYQNLDDLPELRGVNTTTEFLCGEIFRRMQARIKDGALGEDGPAVESMKITLRESPDAWAAFEGPIWS